MGGDDGRDRAGWLKAIRESRIFLVVTFESEGDTIDAVVTDGVVTISVMADVTFSGRVASLTRCHVQGDGANTVGVTSLRLLIRAAKEFLDVDKFYVEGAVRTSGAGPGRRPRPLVF